MKHTVSVALLLITVMALSFFSLAHLTSSGNASAGNLASSDLQVFIRPNQSEVDRIPAGQEFQIEALVSRSSHADQLTEIEFVALLQIRDSRGTNADILLRSSNLASGVQSNLIAFEWTPSVAGTFTYVFFLLSPNDEAPEVLSAVTHMELRIVEPADLTDAPVVDHGTNEDLVEALADYTLMVYMVGSDLETYGYHATEDIIEMMDTASLANNGTANIIVQTGGAANATVNTHRFIDFTRVQTHKVVGEDIQRLRDLGTLNMGDPDTLSGFLTYAATEFPAKNYAVVL